MITERIITAVSFVATLAISVYAFSQTGIAAWPQYSHWHLLPILGGALIGYLVSLLVMGLYSISRRFFLENAMKEGSNEEIVRQMFLPAKWANGVLINGAIFVVLSLWVTPYPILTVAASCVLLACMVALFVTTMITMRLGISFCRAAIKLDMLMDQVEAEMEAEAGEETDEEV